MTLHKKKRRRRRTSKTASCLISTDVPTEFCVKKIVPMLISKNNKTRYIYSTMQCLHLSLFFRGRLHLRFERAVWMSSEPSAAMTCVFDVQQIPRPISGTQHRAACRAARRAVLHTALHAFSMSFSLSKLFFDRVLTNAGSAACSVMSHLCCAMSRCTACCKVCCIQCNWSQILMHIKNASYCSRRLAAHPSCTFKTQV
jgi:hypothetical protein